MNVNEIRNIAVVGAGAMGHGIAQAFAGAGYPVRLMDPDRGALDKARAQIGASLHTLAHAGKLGHAEIDGIAARISFHGDLAAALHRADFVVEAVPEVPAIKREVFARIDALCPEGAILATNTSGLDVFGQAVHARGDNGMATHEIDRIRATHDAIKERVPDVIVNLTSAVGPAATPEQRIAQIVAIRPEMASLNTGTMNFSIVDRKTGRIVFDNVFTNTFTMLQEFGRAMEACGVRPEIEVYDIGGLDNFLLVDRQGIFSGPYLFNFVWGVAGGQRFRPEAFAVLVNALPGGSRFTSCGIGPEQFTACMQSCIMGGHVRVGLEDNTRMPDGELAKGNYELVEWAARLVRSLGGEPASPVEAREILGIKDKH